MLTVQRMKPNFSEFEKIKNGNLIVGCDDDSFVVDYLEHVLKFNSNNIKTFDRENDYTTEFERKKIAAAFLELPYEKLFLNQYCKSYTGTKATYRFGGLGFAFQKGSPIAADFSKEILRLSENGRITELEERWFAPSPECSSNAPDNDVESLNLRSFKGIYIISAVISTICSLLFLIRSLRNSRHHKEANEDNVTLGGKGGPSKGDSIAKYFYNGAKTRVPRRASTFAQALDTDKLSFSRYEYASSSDNLEIHHDSSSQAEIEMP
ncbi:unnamed protein product [Dovyalis caffra]|uniref:Uncharacterized protein n=1 Tax=Dovyalis caffra TaxID=77055 RepID=A0AAV1SGX5_9ROSI|nr:unnamed protein product [Dovyalis caffra]